MTNKPDIVEVRSLASSDISKILSIEREAFNHPWSVEGFRSLLKNNVYVCIGVFRNNLKGYLIALPVLDELHILNIAVDSRYRREGLGSRLMNEALKRAGMEIKTILLEVRESNFTAIKFYKKHGFNPVGRRKSYYPDGEDALLLTRMV